MGYEIMFWVPVIIIFGITVFKNSRHTWSRITNIIVWTLILYGFLFVYPAPLGIVSYKPYIYWKGGNGKGELEYRYKEFKKKMLGKIGIEIVE